MEHVAWRDLPEEFPHGAGGSGGVFDVLPPFVLRVRIQAPAKQGSHPVGEAVRCGQLQEIGAIRLT